MKNAYADLDTIVKHCNGTFDDVIVGGGVLSFGAPDGAATIGITNRDERCALVNFDPDSARPTPEVLKAIVRVRDNKAGVYATTARRGSLAVGQAVFFEPAAGPRERGDIVRDAAPSTAIWPHGNTTK